MDNRIGIQFTSKVVVVKPVNDQMTLCKCYIMAPGKNCNLTNISKEATDKALPTLFNIPVVGHIFTDEDGNVRAGGHDMELQKNEEGKLSFKVLTVPYGVVPQQDNVHYEEVEEKDGTKKDYLVADVILWTGRYPELLNAKYGEDIYFSQSMEILPYKTSREPDGYTKVEEFQFSALCLLGKSDDPEKNVSPAFEQARVEPYDFSANGEWTKLFGEFKEELARSFAEQAAEKGGKNLDTERIKLLLEEFGMEELPKLNFEVTENTTEEELLAALTEFAATQKENAVEDSGESTKEEPETAPAEEPVKFAVDLTANEKRSKLNSLANGACVWTESLYISYSLVDFDDKYAYCYKCAEGEDIEPEQGNVRIPYAEDDGEWTLDISKEESVRLCWLTKEDEDKIAEKDAEFASLVEYKKSRVEEDRRKEYSDVIAEFSDLCDSEEYKLIIKDAMSFESADALTEKLYAIRGRYAKKPAKKPLETIRIPLDFEKKSEKTKRKEEVDEFMSKYLSAEEK